MKKIGIMLGMLCFSTSVLALECEYAPAQRAARDAEIKTELKEMLPADVDLNATYPCGGTVAQLAILRGNPDNMEYLLANGLDPNAEVSLKDFKIPGAPDKIPLPLFAAYYSPASPIIDIMIEYKADFHAVDSLGHNVFWYFEQNPVLRNSYLTKKGYEGILPLRERIRLAQERAFAEEAKEAEEAAKNPVKLVPVRKKSFDEEVEE